MKLRDSGPLRLRNGQLQMIGSILAGCAVLSVMRWRHLTSLILLLVRPQVVRTVSSPEQEATLLKRYRDHDSIPMDSITEDMVETPNSQSVALCENSDCIVNIEPGANLLLTENSTDLGEPYTASSSIEPVTSCNSEQVNTHSVTADVHCYLSGTPCCATGRQC